MLRSTGYSLKQRRKKIFVRAQRRRSGDTLPFRVISFQLNKKHAAVYSWAIRKQSWGWDQATHRLS
jgi:hypothetical protein